MMKKDYLTNENMEQNFKQVAQELPYYSQSSEEGELNLLNVLGLHSPLSSQMQNKKNGGGKSFSFLTTGPEKLQTALMDLVANVTDFLTQTAKTAKIYNTSSSDPQVAIRKHLTTRIEKIFSNDQTLAEAGLETPRLIPASDYFGDHVDFIQLAQTETSVQGSSLELLHTAHQIQAAVQKTESLACGLTLKQLSSAVQRGVENFIFDELRLKKDAETGCSFFCADDAICRTCSFAPSEQDQLRFRRELGQKAFGIDINRFLILDLDVSSKDLLKMNRNYDMVKKDMKKIEVLLKSISEDDSGSSTLRTAEWKKDVQRVLQDHRNLATIVFDVDSDQTLSETQHAGLQDAFASTKSFLTSGLLRCVFKSVLLELDKKAERSTGDSVGEITKYVSSFVIPESTY
jgi:hypothetical protein